MNKLINIKGKSAIIYVYLNIEKERHPNGKSFHRIVVDGNNNEYFKEKKIDASLNLEDAVLQEEQKFIDWVENLPVKKCKEVEILENLGFSN
ncbi:MAG: hypothetical protein PSN34_06405 [Urechidicola sp.]|nr:hypothetical protein [Urechidicola sp.]